MSINLTELLPDEISDEAAFYLANFMMTLATAIESHYFGQIKRYIDDACDNCIPDEIKSHLTPEKNEDDAF